MVLKVYPVFFVIFQFRRERAKDSIYLPRKRECERDLHFPNLNEQFINAPRALRPGAPIEALELMILRKYSFTNLTIVMCAQLGWPKNGQGHGIFSSLK